MKVREDLWTEFKLLCIERQITQQAGLEELLTRSLPASSQPSTIVQHLKAVYERIADLEAIESAALAFVERSRSFDGENEFQKELKRVLTAARPTTARKILM